MQVSGRDGGGRGGGTVNAIARRLAATSAEKAEEPQDCTARRESCVLLLLLPPRRAKVVTDQPGALRWGRDYPDFLSKTGGTRAEDTEKMLKRQPSVQKVNKC